MERKALSVIVVDDDFMIAKVHKKFIESEMGYRVVATTYNYEQTLDEVKKTRPDLLVLDVYLPDRSGIELLRTLRSQCIPCDVILITAATEKEVAEEGFRLGVFDYLIKPFLLDHLKESLVKYQQYKECLSLRANVNQDIVDDLKKIRSMAPVKQLQTGIDFRTLEHIKASLMKTGDFQSAEEVARLAKVSRSTARTYLSYLVEENIVEEKLQYGAVGRPQRLYNLRF